MEGLPDDMVDGVLGLGSVASLPKGEVLFRPAMVQVEVLPAVDTSRWKTADIDRHVAEVRGMFLDALGQTEAKPRRKKAAARKPTAKRKSPARSKRK
jgi:putative phosphoserine phosphatase/1-acylglycerol-3-phosphate O-acyltransferase